MIVIEDMTCAWHTIRYCDLLCARLDNLQHQSASLHFVKASLNILSNYT